MLSSVLKTTLNDFGLCTDVNLIDLDSIEQTAFCWTKSPRSICLANNKKYFSIASKNSNIQAIVAPPSAAMDRNTDKLLVIANDADQLFYYIHNLAVHDINGFTKHVNDRVIADSAHISSTATIGNNIRIGERSTIAHGCLISDNTIIGDDVTIGPNCIIGVDGLFAKRIHGKKHHITHYGGVSIGNESRLHSGVTISRSAIVNENTCIGEAVHIGHGSIIGHDCNVDDGTDISANVLIAGRVRIGRNCWIGANACVSNACSIGDDSDIRIGAVVISDLNRNSDVSGNFAMNHTANLKNYLKGMR